MHLQVGGMDCGSCAKTIEVGLQQIPGVSDVSVNFATERVQLSYDPQQVSEKTIYDRIISLGYTVEQSRDTSPYYHDGDRRLSRYRNFPACDCKWNAFI